MTEALEIEIKIQLGEAATARRVILQAGAVLIRERHFEDNRIFDNPERSLSGRGALIRVRATSDGRGRLTYKEKVESEARMKIRREWEVETAPPETMASILERVGFQVIYRYQKYRTVFRLDDTRIELDETPMGCFVEIEGRQDSIPRVAALLGATEESFITDDYRSLHLAWLEERGLPPGDMVFPDDGAGTGAGS